MELFIELMAVAILSFIVGYIVGRVEAHAPKITEDEDCHFFSYNRGCPFAHTSDCDPKDCLIEQRHRGVVNE